MKKLVMMFFILLPITMYSAVILRVLSPGDIALGVTISEGGLYVLGNDATIATGTALIITTSDVTIDFNNKTIRGINAASCIAINNNLSNVTIKNGKIIGSFNNNGIFVGAGSQNLFFDDLTISGSSNNSTSFNGFNFAGGSPRTSHVVIKNCRINNSSIGLSASQTDDIALEDTSFNFNGTGINITNCNTSYIRCCRSTNNTTASSNSSFGLSLANSNCWTLQNSEFNFNQNTVRGTGVFISNSTNILVDACNFFDNGATGRAEGCNLSQSSSCIIKNCTANGNFSTTSTAAGIRVDTGGVGNAISFCSASVNVGLSTSSTGFGFMVTDSVSNMNFHSCAAEGNSAPSPSIGAGFFVGVNVGKCLIKDCSASFNSNFGTLNNSINAFLVSNVMIGNTSLGYTGSGIVGFVEVVNGSTPPRGTFDERLLDNLAITFPA